MSQPAGAQPFDIDRLARFTRRLRLLSAVGIGGVAAGVLAEAFADHLGPRIPAAMSAGEMMTLPVIWVPLATVLAVAAWTYLLVGALHAPWLLRLVIAGGWAVLAWPFVSIAPLWGAPGYAGVLLLLLWRRWARPLHDFGIWESLIFGTAALFLFLAAGVTSLFDPELPLISYTIAMSTLFATFTVVAMPLLILSGMDLAEVAGKSGGWAAGLVQGWTSRRLAWLLLVLGLAQSGYIAFGGVPWGPGFFLTLLGVGALCYAGRWLPQGTWLTEPPFPLLISMLALAMIAPLGGALLSAFVPPGVLDWLPAAGFVGSAALAALAALLLRRWLNRRWPGAWVALMVGALWLGWVIAGGNAKDWAPSSRGIGIAVGLLSAAVAVGALLGKSWAAGRVKIVLEALLVFAMISAIQSAYQNELDAGDIFAAIQASLVLGSAVWMGLSRHRMRLLLTAVATLAVLGAGVMLLKTSEWQVFMQLILMAVALIWGIVVAHRRMGELLGEGVTQIHQTFLLIGFSLMVVAVLGWNRSLVPAPDGLTDFGHLTSFGLVAAGLPLFLLSVAQRLYRKEEEK